jgi:LysR family transcriptional regulator, glycine cleavage system transcriptional activator
LGLTSEHLFAVCSPKLVTGRHHLSKPSDVLKFPLMHLEDRKDWWRWLEAAGVVGADTSRGPVLNRASMLIDAAVDGQGIALARAALAAWDLITGRLLGHSPFRCDCPRPTGSSARRPRRRSQR